MVKPRSAVVGYFSGPKDLMAATEKVRLANYEVFDCFTPFPVHGLEKAQGLKRSPLPFVTLAAGLTGFLSACMLQGLTSVYSWPLNVGGKPLWSWQAFVPIMFELTVLFAGLATVGAMFLLNGFPNTRKRSFSSDITRDQFAILIEAPKGFFPEEQTEWSDSQKARYQKKRAPFKAFDLDQAAAFLKSVGAQSVGFVEEKGWFE